LSDLGDVEVITSDYKGYEPITPRNHKKFSKVFSGKRSYSTTNRFSRRNFSSEPARLWAKLESVLKANEFFKQDTVEKFIYKEKSLLGKGVGRGMTA
jgi:hypothetical protein